MGIEDKEIWGICDECDEYAILREYDGELICSDCIIESLNYEEGMLFDRGKQHND